MTEELPHHASESERSSNRAENFAPVAADAATFSLQLAEDGSAPLKKPAEHGAGRSAASHALVIVREEAA